MQNVVHNVLDSARKLPKMFLLLLNNSFTATTTISYFFAIVDVRHETYRHSHIHGTFYTTLK